MPSVCVVGLGYVGFPLAELCARKGYIVYALENDPQKVQRIQNERPDFHLNHPDALKAETIVICVPTPVDEKKLPDLTYVEHVARLVAEHLETSGRLVVLESTVNPFVSRNTVLPILESSGHIEGKDFYLAHCPERIDPGNPVWNVSNIPRVVGAMNQRGLEKALAFYRHVLDAGVHPLSSIEAAEMVKIYENSLRAVNIAFANEMAIIMQNMKLDAKEVIEAVKTKPFGLNMCSPGPGVGGHCIPVDPFYLIHESQKFGFEPSFLRTAMRVNSYMPGYTVSLLTSAMNEAGKSVKGSKVGILGVSYKKDVGDIRESPALEIIRRVKGLGADLKIYDPCVPSHSNASADEVMRCEAVMLLTDHTSFLTLDFSDVPVVIDARNVLDRTKINGVYKGIGR